MATKLTTLALLLLAACSGSTAGVDLTDTADDAPPTKPAPTEDITPAPAPSSSTSQQDAGAPAADSGVTQDASSDAALDASDDASEPDSGVEDAAVDATVDAPPPVPRFGVTFAGQDKTGVYAPMPQALNGASEVTIEAYFRLNAATDRGLIFQTPNAYCAVTTGGPDIGTIHCCAPQNELNPCVVGSAKATLGAWRHVAWVLASGNWTLFVDGVKQGDIASLFQSYPAFLEPTDAGTPYPDRYLYLGSATYLDHAVVATLDEVRLSASALYTADFAPPKHLDTPGALNLMLDEGAGTASGPATLYGSAAWSSVSR